MKIDRYIVLKMHSIYAIIDNKRQSEEKKKPNITQSFAHAGEYSVGVDVCGGAVTRSNGKLHHLICTHFEANIHIARRPKTKFILHLLFTKYTYQFQPFSFANIFSCVSLSLALNSGKQFMRERERVRSTESRLKAHTPPVSTYAH